MFVLRLEITVCGYVYFFVVLVFRFVELRLSDVVIFLGDEGG